MQDLSNFKISSHLRPSAVLLLLPACPPGPAQDRPDRHAGPWDRFHPTELPSILATKALHSAAVIHENERGVSGSRNPYPYATCCRPANKCAAAPGPAGWRQHHTTCMPHHSLDLWLDPRHLRLYGLRG